MSAATAVRKGRRAAEANMVDECIISAPGSDTFDPDTGEYTTAAGATLYSGKCQVQVTDTIPHDASVGESRLVVERLVVKIPWDAPEIAPNSIITITAVADVSGSVVGRHYRVTGTMAKTYNTARRLPVELVTP